MGIGKRIAALKKFRLILSQEKERIVNLIHQEVGKPIADASYEVDDILSGIDIYIKRAKDLRNWQKLDYEKDIFPSTRFTRFRKNIGVIGAIMPWNFPFWMPMTVIVPAILSGNPVVLKSSEYACGTGLLIEKLFGRSDFPPNSVQTIIGGPYVGSKMVENEDIGRIFFVGSTETGLNIAHQRIRNKNNHFTLEMGGNSASIILADADLENAVPAVFWEGCYYAGQVCSGTKRLLVQKPIYDTVKNQLLSLAKKYNESHLLTDSIGAIITKEEMTVFEYRINQAIKAGNILLEGGRRLSEGELPDKYRGGNFFFITLMEIKNRNVALIQKETFAPILPLIPFKDAEEAIKIANETIYGLSANVFGTDKKTLDYFKQKLEAGMLFINDSELAYPGGNYWRGVGQSYLSTGPEDKLESMFDSIILWEKNPKTRREYWFRL